jgi:RAB protein geranylgeranyltransferase component A
VKLGQPRRRSNMKKVVLCSGSKCCPEALINGNMITITDDEGNKVTLTKEQVEILWKNLK